MGMWLTSGKQDTAAVDELERSSDRAVGVIAGAMVDSMLSDALRKELRRDDSDYSAKIRKQLFDSDGALGSFGARINLSYLMGFFTPEAHADLVTFSKIRNSFAHYTEHDNFETPSIRDRCSNLKFVDSKVRGPSAYTGTRLPDGTWAERQPMESVGRAGNLIFLNMPDHKDILATSKGRFISTGKLFCAAFTMAARSANELTKPYL